MYTDIFTFTRNIVIASVLMVGMNRVVYAEMIQGVSLGANEIVTAFNSINGNKGYWWWASSTSTNTAGQATLQKLQGGYTAATIDLSAYPGLSGQQAFVSFYLTSNNTYYGNAAATKNQLSYNAVTGTTSTKNQPDRGGSNFDLSVGGAYLYMVLATEKLAPADNPWGSTATEKANNTAYTNAMKILNSGSAWDSNNKYLQLLLSEHNDTAYWYGAYNPDAYYTEIGNYSIFVLNSNTCDDYLYIANAKNPYTAGVPEPGTMLILGLGLVGLPFARRMRKH